MDRWGLVVAVGWLLLAPACGGDDDDDDDDTVIGGEGEGEGECGPRGAACGGDSSCEPAGGDCCTCDDGCDAWECASPGNNGVGCPTTGAVGSPCGGNELCEYCIEGVAVRFQCDGAGLTLTSVCEG